jgi:predicted RNase H-like HicB family nuclease
MSKRYMGVITKEDNWFIARCLEVPVTTQGKTIEEAQANLKEAVELYIESFEDVELPESAGEVMLYPMEVAQSA